MEHEFTVKTKDPIVAALIKQMEKRSKEGAKEYGFDSILERVDDPLTLVCDALEEAIDQIVYLGAAVSLLKEIEKAKNEEEQEEEEILRFLVDSHYPGRSTP